MREGFFLGVAFLLVFFAGTVLSDVREKKEVPSGPGVFPKGQVEAVDPMEDIHQSPRFRYNALGRRDPFLSFIKPSDEVSKGLPPLQQVNLGQLKLIGVAWGGGGYGAMILTPDGRSYPVRKGTKIGTNQGRVKDIGAKEVIVEEPYLNIFGRSDLKQIVMKLYTKKEGIE